MNILDVSNLTLLDSILEKRNNFLESEKVVIEDAFFKKGYILHQREAEIPSALLGEFDFMPVEESSLVGDLQDRWLAELSRRHSEGGDFSDSLWDEIKRNENITSYFKLFLAKRFFHKIGQKYLSLEFPILATSLDEQKNRVCKIFPPPGINLKNTSDAFLKDAYNTIMLDAFGANGFRKIKTTSGLVVMGKSLVSNAYMIVDAPWRDLKQAVSNLYPFQRNSDEIVWLDGYRGARIDMFQIGVALFDGKTIGDRWAFHGRCDAEPRGFSTTSSLEEVLRGKALWYELTILPFEQEIIQTLEAALAQQTPRQAASGEPVSDDAPDVTEQEQVLLTNFCVYLLLPVQWPQERADDLDALTGAIRSFSASEGWMGVELEFEKAISLLDPGFVEKGDQLYEEICYLSQESPLMVLHYAEDHGWGWSVWDKDRCVGGYRLDLEKGSVHRDADLPAILQILDLQPLQVDQMLAALPDSEGVKADEGGWTDMQAQMRQFLRVIGVEVKG